MKDHSESILVEYDPSVIGYVELLAIWSEMAYPYQKDKKIQYRNAIYYTSKDQRAIGEDVVSTIRQQGQDRNQVVHIDIEELNHFFRAECHHQSF
mmetsp:Transcript_11355/g.16683  ORF Transcript_11355/g.16683 Transcript_11355/m.16683 type:complete len:95 (-) Transcript_11355:186-470(-)